MSDDRSYAGETPADEVMQDVSPDVPTVPVRIDEPVRTHELPRISGGAWTDQVDTSGKRLLAADPKRSCATILALDQDVYIGMDQASVSAASMANPSGAQWPANVPLVIQHCDEVWVSSQASTTAVSVLVERWAR